MLYTRQNVVLAAVLTLALTLASDVNTDSKWAVFKQKYAKIYDSPAEEALRRYNWQHNLKEIERHNELFVAGKTSFYMAENKYIDMSKEEFQEVMLSHSFRVSPVKGARNSSVTFGLPKSVDWRTKGYVTKVKDQGPCGSCWAFSTTGGLEGQHFKATGQLVSLSESNLIDCSRRWGNYGCHGGMMDNAYQYIIDNGGIDTEKSYPYDPQDGSCFFVERNIGATMQSYTQLPEGDEGKLQQAVATVGPVSVAINADLDAFLKYGGGVFNQPNCTQGKLDHAVLVVGYGTDSKSGLDYWIVKNSWDHSWGMDGYIWMARNQKNQCGIASFAIYPHV